MSIYSIYFSPTGGVKKVADILSSEFQVDNYIDLSNPKFDSYHTQFQKKDICFISLPVFGGRVVPTAIERLKQMNADETLAIVTVVFGNRAYDDALLEATKETEKCGFDVVAAIAAIAEHSIVRDFGAARPDTTDKKELLHYSISIKEKINRNGPINKLEIPGNQPYLEFKPVPLKPKAGKSCTKCGACAEQCPVNAIPYYKPESTNNDKCISCMRCMAVCPVNARKLNRVMVSVTKQALKKLCSDRKPNELYI